MGPSICRRDGLPSAFASMSYRSDLDPTRPHQDLSFVGEFGDSTITPAFSTEAKDRIFVLAARSSTDGINLTSSKPEYKR